MPYVFTDANSLVGKRPRAAYWQEIHAAIHDLDTRMSGAGSENINITQYIPATRSIREYPKGMTSFNVHETVGSGYPSTNGVVETLYLNDNLNVQHFFDQPEGESAGAIYYRQWNVATSSWTSWNKMLSDADLRDHIADTEQHITPVDRKRLDGFVHEQTAMSATWVINHQLGKYPAITVADATGAAVYGEILFDSLNQVTVRFSAPFAGTAFLS